MVEYAIIVAIISVAAIAVIALIGGQLRNAFESVTDVIEANTQQTSGGG